LAFFAMALGVIGTPAWGWFKGFLDNQPAAVNFHAFANTDLLMLMGVSSFVVFLGLGVGWWLYGNKSPAAKEPATLEKAMPWAWAGLRDRLYVDELYDVT